MDWLVGLLQGVTMGVFIGSVIVAWERQRIDGRRD